DTSCPLPQKYSPVYTEAAWYDWWVKEGFFTPEYQRKHGKPDEKFVICLPPPNVTGTLHLGHALTNSIQDALVRWNRMRGVETLWIPGCDHAGIATQVVVEKKLANTKGITRHELGREKFIEEAWKWKNEKGDTIYEQMKRLGSSLDWNRACFTMDEKMSEAVIEAFITLYEDGLIFRSNKMINWSCQLQSVISDVEVENVQLFRPTKFRVPGYEEMIELGKMTSFAYPVVDSDETVIVATTRPETMLGDTAVAVHPDDRRYVHLQGRVLRHPFVDRLLPIVCDETVEKDLGTGAVKITPAHDFKDHDLAQRHGLESISVIDKLGNMENNTGKFKGMKRFHAREAVKEELKGLGLYKETKPHEMVIPLCSRSGDVIEPMMMEQWFVNCEMMAAEALTAVKLKDVELIPDYTVKIWNHFLGNIEDWCISRQIWWGHRIPMYRAWTQSQEEEEGVWVVGRNEEDAKRRAQEELGQPGEVINIKQDTDVLDTWFSSALFPFSSLGWPKMTDDYLRYYPNTILETGSDILFSWVARMVMMGIKLTDRIPFKTVILHGMLRDANGRKMSKSLGNVIDPVDAIEGISLEDLQKKLESSNLDPREIETALEGQKEDFPHGIPECGTDALRFTLCSYDYKEQSINMNVQHVERNRKFCNKIWQSFIFVSSQLGSGFKPSGDVNSNDIMDQWILGSLCRTMETCDKNFKSYDLHRVCISLYEFWLLEFCGVYLEYSKTVLRKDNEESKTTQQVLYTCMDNFLRALSPFMPYLSEELYQRLPHITDHPSVCVAPYPQTSQLPSFNSEIDTAVNVARSVVTTVLNSSVVYQIKAKQIPVYIVCRNKDQGHILSHDSVKSMICRLSRCKSIEIVTSEIEVPESCIKTAISGDVDVHIFVKGVLDCEAQISRIQTKLEKLEKKLKNMKRKKDDLTPAYEDMVNRVEEEKKELEKQIEDLNNLKS
ncbi:hypothetical protein FSP39_011139, partial [Pinctada imbricata]